MADDCSPANPASAARPRHHWFDKCQALVPIISPIIAVLSFFSGTIFSAYQAQKSTRSAEDNEWRQSLQKATFSDSDMIPSAFLLESFYNSSVYSYREQARELQFVMLDRTSQPEVFDLVFQNMLRDAASREVAAPTVVQDTVHDMLSVGATLNEHIRTMYATAIPEAASRAKTTLDMFLSDPRPFFGSTPQDQGRLNRLYVLMWELDTFSDGMNCVWNTNHSDCPHLKGDVDGTAQVFLMNHPVPQASGHGPQFRTYSTCAVHHAPEAGYYCDRTEEP